MSAIDDLFSQLRAQKRKALAPFITAGDPDLDFTGALLEELAGRGCHLCEVGIPYSDPIADGPVIQASYTRALARNLHVSDILDAAQKWTSNLKQKNVSLPLVSMVSYAIIYRRGLEEYVAAAKAAGLAGAIVPDLLVEEADPLAAVCSREDFSLIQLVTPTTSRERALRIAETSSGFLYYVSVTGITGERQVMPAELVDNVGWLRERTDLPICIGFGVSQVEHVRRLSPVADGLIVGSAIVRRIAELSESNPKNESARQKTLEDVGSFASSLLGALN